MDSDNRRGDGRRGLYMALGSAVTLAVLLAAAIEGPKLARGGAAGAQEAGPAAAPAPPAAVGSAPASISSPAASPSAASRATAAPAVTAAPGATAAPAALLSARPMQQPVPA